MTVPVKVNAVDKMKFYIEYSDGLKGEINLRHLSNNFIYDDLADYEYFQKMTIDQKTKDIIWPNGISLCKNAIYKQLDLIRLAKSLRLDLDKIYED